MSNILKQKSMNKSSSKRKKSSSILKKRKRIKKDDYNWLKENGMEDLQQTESVQELTEAVGQFFFKKNSVDYEQIHVNLIKNNLVPLYDNYISNYGDMYINKDFVLMECIKLCTKLSDKNKVLHVEKCIEFVRYLRAFQEEGVKYRNMKRRFYLNNYPILGVGDLSVILRETDNVWKQQKKHFRYKMGYNVQRMSALFYCVNNFNNRLRIRYNQYQKKSVINVLTQTFIEKEMNDYDFEKIDKYWKEISVKEFEELGNLGSINIQEWKLIEDAFF